MATLAGTLTDFGLSAWDGQFRLRLATSPIDSSNVIRAGSKLFVAVVAGDYSQELAPGIYGLSIPGCPEFFVAIPQNSGTYDIDELIYTPPDASHDVVEGISYFTTLAQMRSDISNSRLAFLNSNANGDFGWYAAAGDTGADDGVNFVWNANGVVYTRKS